MLEYEDAICDIMDVPTTIYVVFECSDDYHGGDYPLQAFFVKETAEEYLAQCKSKPTICSDCGQKNYYIIWEVELS